MEALDDGEKRRTLKYGMRGKKDKSVCVYKCTLLFLPFSFCVYNFPWFMLRSNKNISFLNSGNLKRCFYPKKRKDF